MDGVQIRNATTADAAAIAERRGNGLAERDTHVLDGVMLIDVEIAGRSNVQIERPVLREQLQHVIEEANAGRDGIASTPFQHKGQPDLGLRCLAINQRSPHR